MMDFSLDSPARHPTAADAAAQRSPTTRSLADRRTSATVKPSPSATPRRRRHDNLNTAQHTPLEW